MSVTSAASGGRYLTEDATKTMIHALVTSRLDYCNAVRAVRSTGISNQQNAATAEYVRTYDNENKTSRSYHPSAR